MRKPAAPGSACSALYVTVTVTDPAQIGRAVADTEAAAESSKIRLQRMYRSQAAGFTATLPCGICLPSARPPPPATDPPALIRRECSDALTAHPPAAPGTGPGHNRLPSRATSPVAAPLPAWRHGSAGTALGLEYP